MLRESGRLGFEPATYQSQVQRITYRSATTQHIRNQYVNDNKKQTRIILKRSIKTRHCYSILANVEHNLARVSKPHTCNKTSENRSHIHNVL